MNIPTKREQGFLISLHILYMVLVWSKVLAPVVQKVDSAIQRINFYPLDSAIGFPNTYPLDSDLSAG